MTLLVGTLLVFAVVVSESLITCMPVSTTTDKVVTAKQLAPAEYRMRKVNRCKYLNQYGYECKTKPGDDDVDDETFKIGLKRFQHFAGLNETGDLDADTEALMDKPRCGMKDMDGKQPDGKGRRKRFTFSGLSWSKRSLTYRLGSYPANIISQTLTNTRLREAMQKWTNVIPSSRLTVTEASGNQRPDIQVEFRSGNHGDGNPFDGVGNILAHAFFPPVGDVHFDNDETWIDTAAQQQMNSRSVSFAQVALHEFGHTLGLSHSQDRNAVMAPFYQFKENVQLTDDDIRGIQSIYGAASTACTSGPCQNGGTCTATGNGGFSCTCTMQFSGSTCTTAVVNGCTPRPCQNNGQCIPVGNSYRCTCTQRWTGNNCTQFVPDPCNASPCQNGGSCIAGSGSNYRCICPRQSWTGENCTTRITRPCDSNPCRNGGACYNSGTTRYFCICPTGWIGATCSTRKVNPCENNPCQNGGRCLDIGNNNHRCICPAPWTGTNCSTEIPNPCDSSPCQNNGTCLRFGQNYYCRCPAEWTGSTCGTRYVDPCRSSPCRNGGSCTSYGNYFACRCPNGWTGSTCTTRQSERRPWWRRWFG